MNSLNHRIDAAARAQGFVLVGFARLRELPRESFYRGWLADGRSGEMDYLAREPERRFDPRCLDPTLRSVVSLGYPYAAPPVAEIDWQRELRGRIASYALGEDYHRYVRDKARAVAAALCDARPGCVTRVYVDTGPVFEREWVREAGVGWFGKNTNILNRERGSYVFLAEIFTDAELDANVEPYGDYCGTCRRCLDLCPTQALADGYLIEPRLCISYLTIELRGPIPVELRPKLGNWIFGCDICQEVCPWNGAATGFADDRLAPRLPELINLDEEGFRRRFRASAIKRTKRRGLLRNVAVALGNSANREAVPPLSAALEIEPEPLIRAHVAWALGRLGGAAARRALEKRRIREADPSVRGEVASALEMICA
ncbi:MAG: tRNA epoxyqueuosine(34) reductase QueG [Candidatus Binataceae bacterium]|jgi:epoxyqueuosine reductase